MNTGSRGLTYRGLRLRSKHESSGDIISVFLSPILPFAHVVMQGNAAGR